MKMFVAANPAFYKPFLLSATFQTYCPNLPSLAGCRTWCPTDLQHLCCKVLINKIKWVNYWSFILLWWNNLEATAWTANISICTVTIGWTNYGCLNNQPYLRTETSYKDGIMAYCTHHCPPDWSRSSFVSISIDVTRNKVCFNKEIMIKCFISTKL